MYHLIKKIREKTFQILLLVSLCLVFPVTGGDYYSNSNKFLFAFPRYSSMGEADITFSRDGTPASNPANTPMDSSSQAYLSYAGFYSNILSTSMASYSTRINKKLGIAISIAYLYVPDIEITTNLEKDMFANWIYPSDKLEYSSASEIFFNFSIGYTFFSRRLLDIAAGIALHSQRRRLIKWSGYGIGADVGLTTHFHKSGVRLSLLCDDITTNYIHWSSDYHDNGLPHVYFGFGWSKNLPYIYGNILLTYKTPDLLSNEGVWTYQLKKEDDNEPVKEPKKHSIKEKPGLLISAACYGFEYLISDIVSVRFGFDTPKMFSFGAGIYLFSQSLLFDFAYKTNSHLPGSYNLSMGYRW